MTVFYLGFVVDREDKILAKIAQSAGYADQPDRKALTIDVGSSTINIGGTTAAAIEAFARQLAGLVGLNIIN